MSRPPALFVSHGAPTLAVEPSPAAAFLASYGASLDRPSAILSVSAHWETRDPVAGGAERPDTIHDFGGFPAPLYQLRYPAPGAPEVADRAAGLLRRAGFDAMLDRRRGFDHGTWVPLLRMFPDAAIPVATLSIQSRRGPDHHFAVGKSLRPLRDEGVLIMASGSLTHNLGEYFGRPADAPAAGYVEAFADWVAAAVAERDDAALLDYRVRAPHAVRAHPTDEHLLPLFVAMGAGGSGRPVHRSIAHGVLAMDVYAFA